MMHLASILLICYVIVGQFCLTLHFFLYNVHEIMSRTYQMLLIHKNMAKRKKKHDFNTRV